MGMHFYVSTGNKGGETKSFTALSLTDYLIRSGRNVVISDSEQDSIQATTTSIALNSGIQTLDMDSPSYPALAAWKLGRSSTGWSDCMDDLSRLGFEKDLDVVADTGASQLQALVDNLEVLGAAIEAGMQASIVFLAGRTEDSTVAAMNLFEAVRAMPVRQRPAVWVLLVDQDGAAEDEFDLTRPFKTKDETEAKSILQRAAEADPAHIRWKHIGRWPDIAYNSTMIARRLPSDSLKDPKIGFGTRAKLQSVLRSMDRLFEEIADPVDDPEEEADA